jgi:hypothetical protein
MFPNFSAWLRQVVEQILQRVALVLLLPLCLVQQVGALQCLYCVIPPLGVVEEELLIGVRGETVHYDMAPEFAQMAKDPRGKLPILGVRDAKAVVGLDIGGAPDIEGSDPDVVRVY